jgi:hypothetical protein
MYKSIIPFRTCGWWRIFGDRIIEHLKLTFVAERPMPSLVFKQVALAAAEESVEQF